MTEQRTIIADQPTSMANQSEGNHSAQQANLFLSYSTRDQLVSCLNLVSTILESNQPIPEDAKQRTREKIEESAGLLMKLLPFESTPSADDSATFEERIAAQLTIELPSDEQTRLIKHLLANRNTVLLYDKATDEAKRNLIAENGRIVVQLMNLSLKKPRIREEDGDKSIVELPTKRQRGR